MYKWTGSWSANMNPNGNNNVGYQSVSLSYCTKGLYLFYSGTKSILYRIIDTSDDSIGDPITLVENESATPTTISIESYPFGSGYVAVWKSGSNGRFEKINLTVYITITSAPQVGSGGTATGSGYIVVDGSDYDTPHVFEWTSGNTHNVTAYSNRTVTPNVEQYYFVSWSNAGARSQSYVVPEGDTSITATFVQQFKHIITSSPFTGNLIIKYNGTDYSSPYTTPWVSTNNVFSLDAYLIPTGHNYCFDYWSDMLARLHNVYPTTAENYTATFYELSLSTTTVVSCLTTTVGGGNGTTITTTTLTTTCSTITSGSGTSSGTMIFGQGWSVLIIPILVFAGIVVFIAISKR
jgi:hypothetical protein